MLGATDAEKSSTMINSLDTASLKHVVPKLHNCALTYPEVKEAITAEFGNPETIATRKMKFLNKFL